MYDLKLYSSNVIETELASRIGYISANIITKKRRKEKKNGKEKEETARERGRERGRKMGKRKGKEKENGL